LEKTDSGDCLNKRQTRPLHQERAGKKHCNYAHPRPTIAMAYNTFIWPHLYGMKSLAYTVIHVRSVGVSKTRNQFTPHTCHTPFGTSVVDFCLHLCLCEWRARKGSKSMSCLKEVHHTAVLHLRPQQGFQHISGAQTLRFRLTHQ